MTMVLAALAPAASAEFRYVPPEAPVQAEAPAPGAAGSAAGRGGRHVPSAPDAAEAADGAAAGAGGAWRVNAGGTLRETLDRWGTRAGVDVLVLTDRRYRLHESRDFPGPFAEAVDALFAALAHLPHPPAGALSADGRTLTVLHRPSRTGDER